MTATDLKQKIVRELDTLPDNRMEEFYGVLMNYIRNQESEDEWLNLSTSEQNGILAAVNQIDSGLKIESKEVFERVRNRITNA